ncbi:MAG: ATP-binding protein [Lachnospiraceae bacterium]|nr:ATP-binding protein [Lachnospiraceae bacterium]
MKSKKRNRWEIVDQGFLSLFTTFSVIELTNRGSTIVDGLFVSNFFGPKSLASVGIGICTFSLVGVISGILSVGMQNGCSHKLGRGDMKGFNRLFSSVFYIAAAVSLICLAALVAGAKPLAVLLGASGNGTVLAEGTADYIRGLGLGAPAQILGVILSGACQLDSDKGRVRQAGMINFVFNIIFDMAAVALGLGVFGIGLSTSLARYLQVAYLMLHFTAKDRMLRFTAYGMPLKELGDLLSRGSERALRSLGKVITPMIVNRIVLFFGGTIAMSAFSVQKDFIGFFEIFATGLADATALQSGVYYGEMNPETLRATGKSAHRSCYIIMGVAGALMVILAWPIAGLYIKEQGELFNMVAFAAVMTGLYGVANGLVQSRIAYLNAIKRTRKMQIMTFLSSVVYTVICANTLGKLFGSYGLMGTDLMRVCLLMLTVWIYTMIRRRKSRLTPEDYMDLPEDFELRPGDLISLDICNEEEVSLASEQLGLFCRGHHIDEKTGMTASLCVEELAGNIISHGFPKCRKTPSIDMRVVFRDGVLVVRLRDNCPMFNVEHYIAREISDTEEDGELRLGLRIIRGLAADISYVHTLDTNNVILRFPVQSGG